jgi:CheY-like chemotaxis protein
LVEDDEVDIVNVKRALKKNQILTPLYVASNGVDALNLLRGTETFPPALSAHQLLIILDINMPKMTGLEFLRIIRSDQYLQKIPVVVLTTSNQERDRLTANQLDIAGYILKPVNFDKFVEIMAGLSKSWRLS